MTALLFYIHYQWQFNTTNSCYLLIATKGEPTRYLTFADLPRRDGPSGKESRPQLGANKGLTSRLTRFLNLLQEDFEAAAARIKPVTGLTNDEMLDLYALYKQGTVGDNETRK
jgi:hypothetical protein